MKSFVAIAVLAVAALAASKTINNRIIGGEVAKDGQFPWQAGVHVSFPGGVTFCGGSLVAPQWILTAAHCVKGANGIVVRLGSNIIDEGAIITDDVKYVIHPKFDEDSLENDVALLELKEAVTESEHIKIVKLPQRGSYFGGYVDATVSGWGEIKDGQNDYSKELRYTNLHSITNEECYKYYGIGIIKSTTLCCKGKESESICNGDSGSALTSVDKDGVIRQVAVSSFVSSLGCESGYPSGYVRTEPFLDFIADVTGVEIEEKTL